MKFSLFRILCRVLVVTIFALPFHGAKAGMIGTDQAVGTAAAQADRTLVLSTLSRSDVANQLQAQGVDPEAAKARVAAMTDAEAHALASQIQTAPAGADTSGWVVAAVLALVLWFLYTYR